MSIIPEGKYNASIAGASFGKSKNGNWQIAIQFTISADDADAPGESIAYVGTFTDAATPITFEAIRGCGYDGDDLEEFKMLADKGQLPAVVLVIQHETFEGETRARVRFVNRPGGGSFKFKEEMAPAEVRSFAAQMKSALRSHTRPVAPKRDAAPPAAQRGAAPARGRDGVPPPGDSDYRPARGRSPVDDDLPF